MPNYWILKTEPSTYSFDQLEREKTAVWDGVKNNLALKHMRQMIPGDRVLIYHTGDEKAVVGMAEVVSVPYPDPKKKDPRLVVVDLQAAGRLPQPVSLAAIKAEKTFADLALVKMGRLSVVPATAAHWQRLLQLGGQPAPRSRNRP
jgi:predicted RNA-binding protein with PUA-like domain